MMRLALSASFSPLWRHVAGQLAANLDFQLMLSDKLQQTFFDIGAELFKAKHLADSLERLQQEAFRQRIWRADFDQAYFGMIL